MKSEITEFDYESIKRNIINDKLYIFLNICQIQVYELHDQKVFVRLKNRKIVLHKLFANLTNKKEKIPSQIKMKIKKGIFK